MRKRRRVVILIASASLTLTPLVLVDCVGDEPATTTPSTTVGDGGLEDHEQQQQASDTGATGQGDSAADGDAAPIPCPTSSPDFLDDAIDVAAAEDFVCAVRREHDVVCWGRNSMYHQLAQDPGTVARTSKPIKINGIATGGVPETPVQIATGQGHACVRTASGKAFCWGSNIYGEAGTNSPMGGSAFLDAPKAVVTDAQNTVFTGVTSIRHGQDHTCAIANKKLYCWGNNERSRLGLDKAVVGTSINIATFIDRGTTTEVIDVSPGNAFTCAVLKQLGGAGSSDVACWGQNSFNIYGDDDTNKFAEGPAPHTVLQLGASNLFVTASQEGHVCAKGTSFPVACWGRNDFGQFGPNPVPEAGATLGHAVQVLSLPDTVQRVAAGGVNTCAIRADGKVLCLGSNTSGQLGIGTVDTNAHPTANPVKDTSGNGELSKAFAITVGGGAFAGNSSVACAISGDRPECGGQVYCWGNNSDGELGDNSAATGAAASKSLPVKVVAP